MKSMPFKSPGPALGGTPNEATSERELRDTRRKAARSSKAKLASASAGRTVQEKRSHSKAQTRADEWDSPTTSAREERRGEGTHCPSPPSGPTEGTGNHHRFGTSGFVHTADL